MAHGWHGFFWICTDFSILDWMEHGLNGLNDYTDLRGLLDSKAYRDFEANTWALRGLMEHGFYGCYGLARIAALDGTRMTRIFLDLHRFFYTGLDGTRIERLYGFTRIAGLKSP